jgi:tellurite resistance protein TerC
MEEVVPPGDHSSFRLEHWLGFFILVAILLFIDLFFHRRARRILVREALVWTIFWIGIALSFNFWIYFQFGQEMGLQFLTGYLIEEALSVDNLFVFLVIFRHFGVKPEYQHRILFWGILGAIVMRLFFILAGTYFIDRFHFLVYVLGVFLIFTGFKLLLQRETHVDPERSWVLRIYRRWFPVTTDFEGPKFVVKRDGKRFATPLFLVLVAVETTDLVFAIDSVPAIIAITRNNFIVFTSNIFAILGLRSIYFLLAGIMDMFRFLKVGLSLVLMFVGVKMLIKDVYDMPIQVSLGVIAGILASAVAASLVLPRQLPRETLPPEERTPPQPAEEG